MTTFIKYFQNLIIILALLVTPLLSMRTSAYQVDYFNEIAVDIGEYGNIINNVDKNLYPYPLTFPQAIDNTLQDNLIIGFCDADNTYRATFVNVDDFTVRYSNSQDWVTSVSYPSYITNYERWTYSVSTQEWTLITSSNSNQTNTVNAYMSSLIYTSNDLYYEDTYEPTGYDETFLIMSNSLSHVLDYNISNQSQLDYSSNFNLSSDYYEYGQYFIYKYSESNYSGNSQLVDTGEFQFSTTIYSYSPSQSSLNDGYYIMALDLGVDTNYGLYSDEIQFQVINSPALNIVQEYVNFGNPSYSGQTTLQRTYTFLIYYAVNVGEGSIQDEYDFNIKFSFYDNNNNYLDFMNNNITSIGDIDIIRTSKVGNILYGSAIQSITFSENYNGTFTAKAYMTNNNGWTFNEATTNLSLSSYVDANADGRDDNTNNTYDEYIWYNSNNEFESDVVTVWNDFSITDPTTWFSPVVNTFNIIKNSMSGLTNVFQSIVSFLPPEVTYLIMFMFSLGIVLRFFGR